MDTKFDGIGRMDTINGIGRMDTRCIAKVAK
jgi:hypothetical protein